MNRAERRHRTFSKMTKRIKERFDWVQMYKGSWKAEFQNLIPVSVRDALAWAPYMARFKKTISWHKPDIGGQIDAHRLNKKQREESKRIIREAL